MAKTVAIQYNNDGFGFAAGNRYASVANGYGDNSATESIRKINWRVAGVFSGLSVRVTSNGRNGDSTIKLRKNGSTVNQVVTIPNGTTGTFADASNTDTIAADDDMNYIYETSGSSGSILISSITIIFAATSNTFTMNDGRWAYGGSNAYTGISNADDPTGTEADAQSRYKNAGTIKGLYMNVEDGRSGTTTCQLRKNGSNANSVLSISGTGMFVDTSNTDTVSADDKFCVQFSGGSGTQLQGRGGWGYESTNGKMETGSTYFGGGAFGTGQTRYVSPVFFEFGNTDENKTKTPFLLAGTVSNLQIYLSTNTISATSNFRLRKNGANGNLNVSITSNTTGWFADVSNTDTITASDLINFSLITGGSGTSMKPTSMMFVFAEVPPPTQVQVTKSLKYTVTTTPSAKTKSLQYAVKPTIAITKSLKYTVKISPSAITKSLKYVVTITPSAITKSLSYRITLTPSAITKSLKYAVLYVPAAITKALKYTVLYVPAAITKALEYRVNFQSVAIQKSLQYTVTAATAITKSLKYTVGTTPAAITKSLTYSIAQTFGITKALQYVLVAPVALQKTLAYRVLFQTASITKSLQYNVATETALTKALKYTVLVPSALTKSLQYEINLTSSVVITKDLTYTVTTVPSALQKSLRYAVALPTGITKSLKYTVTAAPAAITKSLQYAIGLTAALTKQLKYSVKPSTAITKTLQYTLPGTPHGLTLAMTYVIRVYPYKPQLIKPYTRKANPYVPIPKN